MVLRLRQPAATLPPPCRIVNPGDAAPGLSTGLGMTGGGAGCGYRSPGSRSSFTSALAQISASDSAVSMNSIGTPPSSITATR